MTRAALILLATIIASAGVAGCAASRPSPGDSTASNPSRVSVADQQVALDFVNAVVQLLEPEASPLHFATDGSEREPVLDTIRTMLDKAGYGVERSVAGGGARTVNHRVAAIESAGERVRRHDLVVGDIELRRSYRSTGSGTLLPASALYVRGADASLVQMMDEALFGTGTGDADALPPALPEGLLANYGYLLTDAAATGVHGWSVEAGGTNEPAGRAPLAALSLERPVAGRKTGKGLAPSANVRELGRSNYASRFAALDTVVEHRLDFSRGSDRLDTADVALIDDVLERFDPSTDVVFITGYSSGGTAGLDANRTMALSRAERVRAALTAVGVPAERVFVEGYWSDTAETDIPSRAATLALRRGDT